MAEAVTVGAVIKNKSAWREIKGFYFRAWLLLIFSIVFPITAGFFLWLLNGQKPIPTMLVLPVEAIAAILFILFARNVIRYRMARCPHCGESAIGIANAIFPFSPICSHCGKNMSQDAESQLNK